jgi:asparagine synthase (glutamine-hydrolysing)
MVRRLGGGWGLFRAGYALRQKFGCLKRRFPPIHLESIRLGDLVCRGTPTAPGEFRSFRESSPARFFFTPGVLPDPTTLAGVMGEFGVERTLAVADDYCRGRFLYYSRHALDLGWPPDWLLNPFTGGRHEARTHWCDYQTFPPALGDIKDVWEPSRFACAYWLVRAYALTSDAKYPRAFWEMFESWRRQNPPNLGPNWKCGQETALRTMAWCFALFAFWKSPATTAERIADLAAAVALQAERIAGNIGYAVSQKNNHGLSEATGLLTVGLLFPELEGARRWEALGRRVLEQEVRRQIYDDGSYVQQSMNYHRVMLHDCMWAIRLAELNGRPLSEALTGRVGKAAEFLFEMLDFPSGRVPNYGPNDGALVLPLSSCDCTDYRPTVQTARYQATGRLVLAPGPWDEMALWLFGADALATGETPVPQDVAADLAIGRVDGEGNPTSATRGGRYTAGGYYTLRTGDTWCMIRCHTYRDRPGHVDMLHVDLWWRGVNVLGDSGSYRYYDPGNPELERYFKDIRAHNTIEIDGAGPLELASRFLWLPWPQARCLEHRADFWQGEHHAYNRPPWHVVHRRSVRIADDRTWTITDELAGTGEHRIALRWHLADGPFRLDEAGRTLELDLACGPVKLAIESPAGLHVRVERGAAQPAMVMGWSSDYYGERRPRPTLQASGRLAIPARITTRIAIG